MKFYYMDMLLETFNEIIKEHSLKYADIDEYQAMLLSKSYGFIFTVYRGEVDLDYINQKEGVYEVFDTSNYFVSQFDANDREGIYWGENVEEKIQADLMLFARGLKNHFANILEGDKKWLEDYRLFELADEPRPLHEHIKQIILGL